jgi:hypothetical protein
MINVLSLHDIIQYPWGCIKPYNPAAVNKLPPIWRSNNPPTIEEITLWEEIYQSPGTLGVFAAFSPRANLYIIVPAVNNSIENIEIFYDEEKLVSRLKDYNIKLREFI